LEVGTCRLDSAGKYCVHELSRRNIATVAVGAISPCRRSTCYALASMAIVCGKYIAISRTSKLTGNRTSLCQYFYFTEVRKLTTKSQSTNIQYYN